MICYKTCSLFFFLSLSLSLWLPHLLCARSSQTQQGRWPPAHTMHTAMLLLRQVAQSKSLSAGAPGLVDRLFKKLHVSISMFKVSLYAPCPCSSFLIARNVRVNLTFCAGKWPHRCMRRNCGRCLRSP
jgi:hypothetical protein